VYKGNRGKKVLLGTTHLVDALRDDPWRRVNDLAGGGDAALDDRGRLPDAVTPFPMTTGVWSRSYKAALYLIHGQSLIAVKSIFKK
jgi:hypothetical protein